MGPGGTVVFLCGLDIHAGRNRDGQLVTADRLKVLINWCWRYLDWPSGPRLMVADAETEG